MIKEKEYKKRRVIIGKKLSKNSVAVVFSSEYKQRSNDTDFPYRQDSNFYYLTGFKEDNSALVFIKKSKQVRTYLFVEPKDPTKELWNGKRLGVKKAKKRMDFDGIKTIEGYETFIKEHMKEKKTLYCDFKAETQKSAQLQRVAIQIPSHTNIAPLIEEMRLLKSKSEINLIQQSIAIAKEAHHKAMRYGKNADYEYKLQAKIEYIFKNHGAYNDAYTSIVAGGNNANTLHYIRNDKPLQKGSLVLIDAGCEYQYYASDITRTFPIGTGFSKAQKELYELVLSTQKKVIDMIRPGVLRSDLQKEACKLLTHGMCRLGILQGKPKKLIKNESYKKYYPHGIGHWLGIDVHDMAPYKDENNKEIALGAGMVLTIEPGIYCEQKDMKIPKKYRGIGIRIEDNILVTKEGYKNLSKEIVKEIADIETLVLTKRDK
ncbi:MAG: aminopeptidase P N-terminal domain-containing protein [Sulfurimonadaceae bacterium]|jgi:Xaa-Pro aminopeptidase|nr:aminopeptidase P N-terminal domain-containing protein [Sulfurimonadaceae bacterium]